MGKRVFFVYMGNPENCNFAELDLPATPWEMVDAMDKLRLSEEQQPYWRLEDAGRYHFLVPYLDDWDFYKVNALAEQLSTFSDVNAVAFEGLVKMAVDRLCKINGGVLTLQRVLDMAYSADRCHVVPGIKDDEALGHFCVENDFLPELENIPEDVLRMLDYARIGKAMREREDGVITPYGYVAQSGVLRQAPPNLGRHAQKPPYMIRFFCINATRVLQLHLPATQAESDAIRDIFQKAGTVSEYDIVHNQIGATASDLQQQIRQAKLELSKKHIEQGRWEGLMLDSLDGKCPFTPEQVKSRLDSVKEAMTSLSANIKSLEARLADSDRLTQELKEQHLQLLSWAEMFDNATLAERKLIASHLIRAVTLTRGYGIQVDFNISEVQYLNGMEL